MYKYVIVCYNLICCAMYMILVYRMDAAIHEDLVAAGFTRPECLGSRFATPEGINRWLGICNTSAPFEFTATSDELSRIARRSKFFASMLRHNAHEDLLIPVPVYIYSLRPESSGINNRRTRLCDIVKKNRPDLVIPYGHPARRISSCNTAPPSSSSLDTNIMLHGSIRPTVAMSMSIFMCACMILKGDALDTFKDYSFSHYLENKIGEFLHVANLIWSEYLVIWGIRNLCTDRTVFRFLQLMKMTGLGASTPWGRAKDILLHKNSKLSSHTIYGIASAGWHTDMPLDIEECKRKSSQYKTMENLFWNDQYLVHGETRARLCAFCNGMLGIFHPDTHVMSRSVDLMPCCLATAHRECVYNFIMYCWTCPHEESDTGPCESVRDCALNPDINPWNVKYCTRKGWCPRCGTPFIQGALHKKGITRQISTIVTQIRARLVSGIQLYHSEYGIDCAFNQLMLIAHHIHGLQPSTS